MDCAPLQFAEYIIMEEVLKDSFDVSNGIHHRFGVDQDVAQVYKDPPSKHVHNTSLSSRWNTGRLLQRPNSMTR